MITIHVIYCASDKSSWHMNQLPKLTHYCGISFQIHGQKQINKHETMQYLCVKLKLTNDCDPKVWLQANIPTLCPTKWYTLYVCIDISILTRRLEHLVILPPDLTLTCYYFNNQVYTLLNSSLLCSNGICFISKIQKKYISAKHVTLSRDMPWWPRDLREITRCSTRPYTLTTRVNCAHNNSMIWILTDGGWDKILLCPSYKGFSMTCQFDLHYSVFYLLCTWFIFNHVHIIVSFYM